MSSPFGELTDQAHQLVSAGDLAGAQELLADALAEADPRPANATPELAEAAGLQARVLVTLGEPHSARGWAAFAYAAMTRLHGQSDQRTIAAAATLAAVLHRVGSYARAARLYQEVIIELTALDGPESLRVLAAHADLATVEYARGECTVARERLQDAWELHREVYGDGHVSGIKMLARLGAMQRDCGQFADAHENLALARELCRQYLSPDDPLATQVATLARAAANPDHACDEGPPEAPVVPAARTPTPEEGETAEHWPPTVAPGPGYPTGTPTGGTYPGEGGYPGTVPHPRTPTEPRPPADRAVPPADLPPPAATGPYPDHRAPGFPDSSGFPDSPASSGFPEAAGSPGSPGFPGSSGRGRHGDRTYAHDDRFTDDPRHGGGVRYGDVGPESDDWWPPDETVDRSAEVPPVGQTTEAALPPAVFGLTRESAGVHRVGQSLERRGPRLPVHVPRPPEPPRRLAPLIVAGVVVVLLGTGAVIAGVARVDDPVGGPVGPLPTAGAATTAASAGPVPTAAPPGAPPTRVTLTDNRDSVALSWTYPAGAEGPVVVSGGRVGQDPRAFQELPAGSTSYIVYGLNRSTDYCFVVAVVHSANTVGRAKPVCTKRG